MALDNIHKTVTGQQIIDAVEASAQEPRVERDYVNGEDVFIVGQHSAYPYKHILVTADGSRHINPAKTYNLITVMEHDWGGLVFALGYSRDDVIAAVKEFAQKLRQQLEA